MTVSAPPRPSGPAASIEADRVEALIAEARHRTRRRRRIYGIVAGAVAVIVAALALVGTDSPERNRAGSAAATGAAGSDDATSGELVASMYFHNSANPWGLMDRWWYLYEDGRVIYHDPGGWQEQRLTSAGAEVVRCAILAAGLFDAEPSSPQPDQGAGEDHQACAQVELPRGDERQPRQLPAGSKSFCGGCASIQVRDGGRLVATSRGSHQHRTAFDLLTYHLSNLQTWLPETAWVDGVPRTYRPARYAIGAAIMDRTDDSKPAEEIELAEVSARLPDSIDELLDTFDVAQLSDVPHENDPAGLSRDGDGFYWDVTRDQAAQLADALAAVDVSPEEYWSLGREGHDDHLEEGWGNLTFVVDVSPSEAVM